MIDAIVIVTSVNNQIKKYFRECLMEPGLGIDQARPPYYVLKKIFIYPGSFQQNRASRIRGMQKL